MPAAPVVTEPRAGEEYPDLLAQVIRTARQRGGDAQPGDDNARARVRPIVEQSARAVPQLPAGITHDRVIRDAVAEIAGLGAYELLLEDGEVSAACVDHRGRVSITRAGNFTAGALWFSGPTAAAECTERLLRAHGVERKDRAVVHATLHDGTLVTALFAPLAHTGVVVEFERAPRVATLADMGARGLLPPQAVNALTAALAQRRNLIVTGGRGSGRSAVLSALVASLPASDRVVAIEDRDELTRARRDSLTVRADGDWSAALDAALGLRAGRVVYGEGKDACVKSFVSSLVTGAEGAMIAVVAPTAAAALARITEVGVHGEWLPRQEVAGRLLATRPLVIETARLGDGQCRIVGIGEVRQGADGWPQVAPMFSPRIDGPDASGNLSVQLVPAAAGY